MVDPAEKRVDRVGVVDQAGMNAKVNGEILTHRNGIGGIEYEIKFDTGRGEPSL